MADNEHDKEKTLHPLSPELEEKRQTVIDLRGGTRVLREKYTTYLPQFDAESDLSYENRKKTATFLSLYPKTEQALTGLVFQEPIELGTDVPPQIVDLVEDIDNCGNHLDVFAKDRFLRSLDGASCILVSYPPTPKEAVVQTSLDDKYKRPYFVAYNQSQVINWKTRSNPITKEREYSLVVLKECFDESPNLFERETVDRYLVLFLDETNVCNYRVYEERETQDKRFRSGKRKTVELVDEGFVWKASVNGTQTPFNKIPFAVIGDLGNEPPLLDIADKNIEHFQTYSDYKSLIHKTCVPVPYVIGEGSEIKEISGDTLIQIPTGQGNSFGFAEVSGSSLNIIRQCLEDIKAEIGLLGLTAVVDDQTQKAEVTATEVLINSIEETSFLATQARALQDALEQCFIYMAQYLGLDEGGSLELGTAWRKAKMQAEQVMNQSDSPPNQTDGMVN